VGDFCLFLSLGVAYGNRPLHLPAYFYLRTMYLNSLHLVQFRNHPELKLQFGPGVNALIGPNGCGKTNVLDAVHYLSMTKSFLQSSDQTSYPWDLAEDPSAFFMLEAELQEAETAKQVYLSFSKQKGKVLKWNQKTSPRLSEHMGRFPTVVIAPQDGALVTGGSEGRRRFLDALISQYDSLYLDSLIRYNRAILQRNAFLKTERPDLAYLQVMDEQIVPLAMRILNGRIEFIALFMPVFQRYYEQLAQYGEQPELRYEAGALPDVFEEQWRASRNKDLQAQFTTLGPHRDDLGFELKGHNLKKFGSQGQQKTYLVALKLAEHAFLRNKLGLAPVLLLDDVFDKLDPERVRRLLDWANSGEVDQVLLTDTGEQKLAEVLKILDIPARFHEL